MKRSIKGYPLHWQSVKVRWEFPFVLSPSLGGGPIYTLYILGDDSVTLRDSKLPLNTSDVRQFVGWLWMKGILEYVSGGNPKLCEILDYSNHLRQWY